MRLAVTEVWSLVDGSSEERETVVLLADHHTALPLEEPTVRISVPFGRPVLTSPARIVHLPN